jgi:hypothetical protein
MTTTEQSFRSLSPYACAKVINPELEELGLPTLPPQMFYQYVAKGYITSFVDAAGKRKVNELDLATWFQGYLEKKATLAAKKAEKIAAGQKKATTPPCADDSEVDVPTVAEVEAEEMVAVADMEPLTDEELASIDAE